MPRQPEWPEWYKARCVECVHAKTLRGKAHCVMEMWEHLEPVETLRRSPPYDAIDCHHYEPMDLEPDGSPIEGADYPDRDEWPKRLGRKSRDE